jgi:hypothetical protein
MEMKIISVENRQSKSGGRFVKEMVVEVNGQRATVTFSNRGYNETYRERKRKSRLSVYGNTVESLADNFVNRTRRPYKVYRDAAKPFLEALGLPTKGIVWNQYAYCSCPCSPAFIMPEAITRKVGYDWLSWSKESVVVKAIVDIRIHIHDPLPLVDEQVEVDINRVEAFANWAGLGSELVPA